MRILFLSAMLLIAGSNAAQDLDTAAAEAERLAQQEPSAANWQKLGLARYLQNRFAPAADAFVQALKRDPNLWPSHLFLGVSLYRQNHFERALQSLTAADRLSPQNSRGRDDLEYWLGATYIALGQPLTGLQNLEKLLARSPSHVPALQLATETYAETASSMWNAIAEESFKSSAGQEVHGYALESEGNIEGALSAFRQASSVAPQRYAPVVAAGRLLLRKGALSEARIALAKALLMDPAAAEANFLIGLLATAEGRWTDAVDPLAKASMWMPENEEPLLALGQVWLSLKQPARAVEVARETAALDPRSGAAHELLVTALTAAADDAAVSAERQRWRNLR